MLEENKSNEKELQRLNEEAQQSLMAIEDSEESDKEENILDDELEDENELSGQFVIGINEDLANKQLLFVTNQGYVGKASDYLDVVNVIKNLDTQKIRGVFRHLSNYCDNEVTIEMGKLKKGLLFNTLTSKGIVAYEWCIGGLSEHLISLIDEWIKQGKMVYQHERLGWSSASDLTGGFLASNSIGTPYASIMRGNDNMLLGPHGDRAIYDAMIQKEVIPNQSLHLPFVLAFTAPIVPLMYGKSACPVLMTNFAGKSSQGKTTSLALMASIWGRGIIDNSRLSVIKSFASTQNGFEAAVNKNYGVPVLFDDYEAAPKGIDFGTLIYTLAQGESKIRCDKNGHTKDTYQWRTSIALTGEASIFDRAGSNLGLKPRIVEFKNKAWTVSKENSIGITSVITENYGFYGEEFVRGLLTMTQPDLEKYYDDSNSIIESLLPSKDNISERIQTRLVLIRMTAELVNKILGLNVDVDYITDFLVKNEQDRQESLDIYEEAKEKLAEYITTNLYRFVRTDKMFEETLLPNASIVGRIYNGRQGYIALLTDSAFQSVMSGFNDRDAILEHWRDEGFLLVDKEKDAKGNITFSKRMKKRGKLCSQSPQFRFYTFLIEDLANLKTTIGNADEVSLQDLVDEDREYLLNHPSEKAPEYTFFKGRKYKLVGSDEKKMFIPPALHDLSKVEHSTAKPKEEIKETTTDITEYDDSEAIEEIFKEEESKEDNDND